MTHDQLQAKCFQWAHNTFPIIRGQLFAVQNEVPPHPGESKQSHLRRISHYKSIGLLSGALDLLLLCPGAPYGFDAKVGKDKISDRQLAFIGMLTLLGGCGYEFRDESTFQRIFTSIIRKHYGTDPKTAEILCRISA